MDLSLTKSETSAFRKSFQKSKPYMLKVLKLKVTNACNSKCSFCSYWKTNKSTFLDKKTIFKIIDDSKSLGLQKVTISGGEPLLHPDIIKILKKITSNNLKLTLITNGLLFNKKKRLILKSIGSANATIVFSMDGASSEIHDKIRGVKGSWSEIIKAINYLNSSKKRPQIKISISATLSEKNFDELGKIILLSNEHQYDSLSFYPARNLVGNYNKPINTNWIKKMIKTKSGIYELAQKTKLLKENITRGFDTLENKKETKCCFLPFFQMEVDATGETYGCCHALENKSKVDLNFGNINHQSAAEVWQSKTANEFRQNCHNVNYSFCKDCIYNYLNNKIAGKILRANL